MSTDSSPAPARPELTRGVGAWAAISGLTVVALTTIWTIALINCAAPRQALQGAAVLLLRIPFYWFWSRRTGSRA
jgi:hypothetical protein